LAIGSNIDGCLRVLGVDRWTSGADLRAAFRRLAKRYHPDLNGTRAGNRRFIEVVQAYRVLQHELNLHPDGSELRRCPRCGRYAELLDGLDGRAGCADCLLGRRRWTRYLPMPLYEIVRHFSVVGCYAASAVLALRYVGTGQLEYSAFSLAAALGGLLVLALTCVRVRDVA